ncbi:MAG: EamA family transporter [bacterium]
MTDPAPVPLPGTRGNRPALGFTLYLAGALCFAFNSSVVKTILETDVDAPALSAVRSAGAFLLLLVIVAVTRPSALRIRRDEALLLLAYGVVGLSMTQFLYFVAIENLPIGVALILEFTAPILVVLWVRFGRHEYVRPWVWLGLALALFGLALITQVWQGLALSALGVAAGLGAACALALFYILGEAQQRGTNARDAVSLTMWGFGGAALFWSIVQPWWNFPWSAFSGDATLVTGPTVPIWSLTAWMVVMGTVVPFTLVVAALAWISAAQASTVGMIEPLAAALIAWILLGEVLTPLQILGGITVLAGVYIAERSR